MEKHEMLHRVRQRYSELYLETSRWDGAATDAALDLKYTEPDGEGGYIWSDIDYSDRSRSTWKAAEHYSRLVQLLQRDGEARLRSDAEYREKAIGLVRHWIKHDYRNPNWWHNDIGMPNGISALTLILYDILPADVLEGATKLVARGSLQTRPEIDRWTGANLIWGIGNTIRHALLTEDTELMARASERAQAEISIGGKEGIQSDGSFRQHGPRWYSGGYGASFTYDISQLAYVLAGTDWEIEKEKMSILLTHVLDGQSQMMHHGYFDYNGVGRELTRPGVLKATGIHKAVELLCRIDGIPRIEELQELDRQNKGGTSLSGEVKWGTTRHYPAVSYLAHNEGGRHIGIKCHAPGQYDMEVCNSEGYLCYNMSYGTRCCHMARGDEYLDINPIYDYAYMPGTVARKESDEQLKTHVDWWNLPLPNDKTAGTVKGDRGIVSQHPEHDGITAKVTFFVYGGGMIALGTDINDEHPERGALHVTVEQCRPINTEIGEDKVKNGGFEYFALEEGELCAEVLHRHGSWHRNSYEREDIPVEGELLLCYMPVSGESGSYAYAVRPTGSGVGARVLANTHELQAILTDDGVLMAMLHTGGEWHIDGMTVKGDAGECVIHSI